MVVSFIMARTIWPTILDWIQTGTRLLLAGSHTKFHAATCGTSRLMSRLSLTENRRTYIWKGGLGLLSFDRSVDQESLSGQTGKQLVPWSLPQRTFLTHQTMSLLLRTRLLRIVTLWNFRTWHLRTTTALLLCSSCKSWVFFRVWWYLPMFCWYSNLIKTVRRLLARVVVIESRSWRTKICTRRARWIRKLFLAHRRVRV